MERTDTPPITGWQRVWIVLAVLVVLPAITAIDSDAIRWVLYALAIVVVLAAMGVVELAMALWYRARR